MRAERLRRVALHLAVRVADDRDLRLRARRTAPRSSGSSLERRRRGPRRPTASPRTRPRRDRRCAAATSGPSSRRPIIRRSACSSSSTSTSTNGRSSSKPGRNDWRTMVHERSVPRPLTGSKTNAGSVRWQCEHTMSGGMENISQREHRATVSTWSAAPPRTARDRSSGTGTGRVACVTGSPRPPAARRSVPRCSPSSSRSSSVCSPCSGARRSAGGRSSNCTGHGRESVRGLAVDHHVADVARWRSPADRRAVPRPPAPAPTARRSARATSSIRRTCGWRTRSSSSATHASACSRRGCEVDEARVVGEVLAAHQAAEVGPVTIGLEEHQTDVATVLRAVGADERVHERAARPTSRAAAGPAARRARPTTASTSRHRAATRRPPSRGPVRVRLSSADAIPNASAMAPLRSPIAPRWPMGWSRSCGVSTCAMPPRAQNADAS